MLVLHSWLNEFAPGLAEHDPDVLGDAMSALGLCCERITRYGGGLDGIVVARVLELSPHPDADRIQLVQVDAGDGQPLQICCGAFNMAVGDLVPLATLGTTMPSGMEIARRKLRGEYSNGMLCSASELELASEDSGIMILDVALIPGTALTDALEIDPDALFDLDLTPNRPDALSVVGVARDLAAHFGTAFALPRFDLPTSGESATSLANVDVQDGDLCGRFTARVLSNIAVGESPDWLATRLTRCGMRPINSIVDISNYVMLEFGQPSHTFDLDKVAGSTLRIRRANQGETITTLDDAERTLVATDGVIADGNDTPIGIAGVMGGASTEISATTTSVLLEAAWWQPASIGATSKRLGLRSEASSRFEKGVDPNIASAACARFAQLACAAGATLHPGEIVFEDGSIPDRTPITVRPARVNALLGSDIARDQMISYLDPIGFTATPAGDDLLVDLPSWRPDSTGEIDVVEEIARHHGYERLGKTLPSSAGRRGSLTDVQRDRRVIAATLRAMGVSEAKPMPFLAPGDLERFGIRTDAVSVTNPLVTEESVLRTSTLPGLVMSLARNAARRSSGVWLFEMGHCFAQGTGGQTHQEWDELGIALAGTDANGAVAFASAVVASLGRPEVRVTSAVIAGLHPTRAATVTSAGVPVGEVGEVDPLVTESLGISERVAWVRLDLDAVFAIPKPVVQAAPTSRFPTSDVDLAFVLNDSVPAHVLVDALADAHPLVTDVSLFDVFRSDRLGVDLRSLTCSIRLQSNETTMTDEDLLEARTALLKVAGELGAVLRS